MTCIVAYINQETKIMYMGGDSLRVENTYSNVQMYDESKVVNLLNFPALFGTSGDARLGQIYKNIDFKPLYDKYLDLKKFNTFELKAFMIVEFVPFLHLMNKQLEISKKDTVTCLVCFQGKIFQISTNGCVTEQDPNKLIAIGCGANDIMGYYNGYKKAYSDIKKLNNIWEKIETLFSDNSLEIIYEAMAYAETKTVGIKGPFEFKQLNYEKI